MLRLYLIISAVLLLLTTIGTAQNSLGNIHHEDAEVRDKPVSRMYERPQERDRQYH